MYESLWTDMLGVEYAQRYIDVRGVRTCVLEAGDPASPPLVFLHGVNGHAEAYTRNIAAHAEHFRVYSVDMIGHGLSDKPLDRDYEIPTYVQHVLDLLDTLGFDRVLLSGESLGGWVAARLVVGHPQRVERLVLNTPGGLNAEPEVMERIKRMTLDAVSPPTREKVQKRVEWLFKDPSTVPPDLVETRYRIYSQPGYREATEKILCLQEMEVRQRNMLRAEDLNGDLGPDAAGVEHGRPDRGNGRGTLDARQHPRLRVPVDGEQRPLAPVRGSGEVQQGAHSVPRAPEGVTVMLRSLEEKVDPRHAAVVVVDVQNDFCADDGAMARIGRPVATVQAMVPVLQALLEDARAAGVPVIFVQYGHTSATESEVHLEQRMRGRSDMVICRQGTWGADFYGVAPEPGETVVQKHRYSGFIGTDLDLILRSTGRRVLVMTGIATNGCVEATARDGFMHDYYIVLVDDCCSCFSPELHQATLQNIRDAYGVVTTADQLSGIWTRSRSPVTSG